MTRKDEKLLEDYMEKRLGKKKHFSSLRPSKEVRSLFGSGSVGHSLADLTRMRIEEKIKFGKITTTDEIDQIIENSCKKYKELVKKSRVPKKTLEENRQKLKGEPQYKFIHKFHKEFLYNNGCNVQILEDKVKVNFENDKAIGRHKPLLSRYVFFKGINFMVLNKNKNKFGIKANNGTEFIFIGEKPWDINYTENLFNELESKVKEYQIKNLNELKESNLITNEEYTERLEGIRTCPKAHEEELNWEDVYEKPKKAPKKVSKEKKENKKEPTLKIVCYPVKGSLKTYTEKPVDLRGVKRAGNVLGGAVLLGPVGALAGYALSNNKPPEPKTKTVPEQLSIKRKCHFKVYENKLKFSNRQESRNILFKEINSLVRPNSRSFEIKMKDSSKFVFFHESGSPNGILPEFHELHSKFNEYQSKNKPEVISESKPEPQPKNNQKDPIDQIKKLNELKEAGIITNEEFEDKKKELLNRI